jgi:hypothetical protein
MIEVTVKSGFAWTDLIIPAGTIFGVWLAYGLHRCGMRRDLQREKAEQIFSEVVDVESQLWEIYIGQENYERIYKDRNKIKQQLSAIEARIEVYLPQYEPPDEQIQPSEHPENIINCIYLLRNAIEVFCDEWGSQEAQSLAGDKVKKRAVSQFRKDLDIHLSSLLNFKTKLSEYIQNTFPAKSRIFR